MVWGLNGRLGYFKTFGPFEKIGFFVRLAHLCFSETHLPKVSAPWVCLDQNDSLGAFSSNLNVISTLGHLGIVLGPMKHYVSDKRALGRGGGLSPFVLLISALFKIHNFLLRLSCVLDVLLLPFKKNVSLIRVRIPEFTATFFCCFYLFTVLDYALKVYYLHTL